MKKLAAIFLLGIFAFNIFGYKIYFDYAESKTDVIIEKKIEKQEYQTEELVTFKFSAKQLPYYTNSKSYEIVNGEIDVNGTIMTYVKKRIFKDSIEYVCLPNIAKTNLRTAREDFFKLVNDLQNNSNKHSSKKQSISIKPFSFDAIALESKEIKCNFIAPVKKRYTLAYKEYLPNPSLRIISPPPNSFI